MHCVDLGESFHMSIYLQNLASIQPTMSLVKFARSPRTDPPGLIEDRRSSYASDPDEGGLLGGFGEVRREKVGRLPF